MHTSMPSKPKSKIDNHFKPGQENDILRVASYHRHDQDRACITFAPDVIENVQKILCKPCHGPARGGLGILDVLPLEITQEVLRQLDVASLLSLRRVNDRGREIVNSLPEWKLVTDHALETIHALVKVGAAAYATLGQLATALLKSACFSCGRYGSFFNLAALVRCCAECRDYSPMLATYATTDIKKHFSITDRELKNTMPVLRVLRGAYYVICNPLLRRYRVVVGMHIHEALDAGLRARREDYPANLTRLSNIPHRNRLTSACMLSIAFPFFNKNTKRAERGVSCKGCQVRLERAIPMAKDCSDLQSRRDICYSEKAFMEHFQECAEAQSLWRDSEEGSLPITDSSWIVDGGWEMPADVRDHWNFT